MLNARENCERHLLRCTVHCLRRCRPWSLSVLAEIANGDRREWKKHIDFYNYSDYSVTKGNHSQEITTKWYSMFAMQLNEGHLGAARPPPPGCRKCIVATNIAEVPGAGHNLTLKNCWLTVWPWLFLDVLGILFVTWLTPFEHLNIWFCIGV